MPDELNGWTKLYHPSGAQVTLPIPFLGDSGVVTSSAALSMLHSVSAYIAAGWLVTAPGLDEGERLEEIRHVVRRSKTNDDGTETPVIDLYPERANFRVLGVYLNTPEAVSAFESACGVRLDSIKLYEADGTIERGKSPKLDKYVLSLPRATRLVLKNNPKWEGDEDKKHPKRLFVRWADNSLPVATSGPLPQNPVGQPESGLEADTYTRPSPAIQPSASLSETPPGEIKPSFIESKPATFSVSLSVSPTPPPAPRLHPLGSTTVTPSKKANSGFLRDPQEWERLFEMAVKAGIYEAGDARARHRMWNVISKAMPVFDTGDSEKGLAALKKHYAEKENADGTSTEA